MLEKLHNHNSNRRVQLPLGFLVGVVFGFLLQKGGVTNYDVIMGQLLLRDFTVVKVMLSAVATGMVGVYVLKGFGLVQLYPKSGSVGSTIPGGLVFGVGFGLLGYCPGTVVGAVAQGWLDALVGGVAGLLFGSSLYAAAYPWLKRTILSKGDFGAITLPQLLKVNAWVVIVPVCAGIIGLFCWLEVHGF